MLGKQWLGQKLAQRVGKGLKKKRERELGRGGLSFAKGANCERRVIQIWKEEEMKRR